MRFSYFGLLISFVFLLGTPALASESSEVDTTPPKLTYFSISTEKIDVSKATRRVTMTVRVEEENGIDNNFLYFKSPSEFGRNFDRRVFVCQTCVDTPKWTRIEGTNEYEVEASFEFDKDAPGGVWSGYISYIRDEAGNTMQPVSAEALSEMGFSPTLKVINPRDIDVTPPDITGFSLSTESLNINGKSGTVTATITATEELEMGAHFIELKGPGDTHEARDSIYVCGSNCSEELQWEKMDESGLYKLQASFYLPENAEHGIWRVEAGRVRDALGNATEDLTAEKLAELGFNARFSVNNEELYSLSLLTDKSEHFIEAGTQGELLLTLEAKEGTSLPPEFQITMQADSAFNIDEAFDLQDVSNSMSCSGYNTYRSCSVAIPDGYDSVSIISKVM